MCTVYGHKCLSYEGRQFAACMGQRVRLSKQMPGGKILAYRSEAPAVAAEGMEDEVQLLLGPVWHKSVHKVAGCAHSAAWPQEGVIVHAVVACKPCNNLSGGPARICCATGH